MFIKLPCNILCHHKQAINSFLFLVFILFLDIPDQWIKRGKFYTKSFHEQSTYKNNLNLSSSNNNIFYTEKMKQIENERIYPSKLGNFIYTDSNSNNTKKLVCYYSVPLKFNNNSKELYPNIIDPHLCTHINVGIVDIDDNQLKIGEVLDNFLKRTAFLKKINQKLKILIWVSNRIINNLISMLN